MTTSIIWEGLGALDNAEGERDCDAIFNSWPPHWTHPVSGAVIVDGVQAREAITWVVQQQGQELLNHAWVTDAEWLEALVGLGFAHVTRA